MPPKFFFDLEIQNVYIIVMDHNNTKSIPNTYKNQQHIREFENEKDNVYSFMPEIKIFHTLGDNEL